MLRIADGEIAMDLEQKAIERIKIASEMSLYYYSKPLICAYSGGKDSDVMLELFKRSGQPFSVSNSHTTVDAPQTVYHIRKVFKKLEEQGIKATIEMPYYKGKRISMWTLILLKKMPPTRIVRYCCSVLKETSCPNSFIATGVRWDESNARKERETYEALGNTKAKAIRVSDEVMLMNDNSNKRMLMENCMRKNKMVVNPIIDWSHRDIWDYIRSENIEYNPLYDCGYSRVGCIGCPMAGKHRYKEFSDFPTYKEMYIKTFDNMLLGLNNSKWKSGKEVFDWYMEDKNIAGQLEFEFKL